MSKPHLFTWSDLGRIAKAIADSKVKTQKGALNGSASLQLLSKVFELSIRVGSKEEDQKIWPVIDWKQHSRTLSTTSINTTKGIHRIWKGLTPKFSNPVAYHQPKEYEELLSWLDATPLPIAAKAATAGYLLAMQDAARGIQSNRAIEELETLFETGRMGDLEKALKQLISRLNI